MYRQHFGLRCAPLDKDSIDLWDDGAITHLRDRFQWLLDSPGVGLLTGEPGVGKTATLRHITSKLNPHRYQVIYTAETDFGRVDLYRALARALGLEPSYRRADLWRDIKQRITELAQSRQITPVWIVDESQHLAAEFFRDLPSFLNFSQDARDLITVWLVGHPSLAGTLEKAQFSALHSRIQVHVHFTPMLERERFSKLIAHALGATGCTHTLLSDSALEQLREASRGVPRQAGRILRNAMRLAVPKGLNHIPDELLQRAIEEVR